MKKEHYKTKSNLCYYLPLDGNLIEQVSGTDYGFRLNESWPGFKISYTADPVIQSRQCAKKVSTNNTVFVNFREVVDYSYDTPKNCINLIPRNTTTQLQFIDRTFHFSYYPSVVNTSKRFILNTCESTVRTGGQVKGIDIFQTSNYFHLVYNNSSGNNRTLTILNNVDANKWYDFQISCKQTDSSHLQFSITILCEGVVVSQTPFSSLGDFPITQTDTDNYLFFFNSWWRDYNTRNFNGLLKDLMLTKT